MTCSLIWEVVIWEVFKLLAQSEIFEAKGRAWASSNPAAITTWMIFSRRNSSVVPSRLRTFGIFSDIDRRFRGDWGR